MEKSRKPRVTEEHLAEAARLKQLWESKPHPTQAVFAEQFDIGNQSAVYQFLNGKVPLSLKAAKGFAAGLNCSVVDFSPRLATKIEDLALHVSQGFDDFADVKRLDVAVSAGHGAVPYLQEELGSLKFRRDFLQAVGVSERTAVVVQVKGASMEPTIHDGAVLLVNRANREPRERRVFVFARDDGLLVKRVVKENGVWLARSDNDDRDAFPDFPFQEDQTLIGRAVWMGAKL